MHGEHAGNRPYRVAVWRAILIGWLGWSQARFDRWVAAWEEALNDEGDHWFFYHENSLHWILGLLVPDDLALRLQGQRTRQMYNDAAELAYMELHPAIAHDPHWDKPEYDWNAGKKRAEEVLARYGATLPSPDHVTSYEQEILDEGPLRPSARS